ncbi:MAG: helix-turn-helix domain-containing protein [Corynebacterium casei]|uniref:helix-turn-helix domain-containing protein n=1 Tax=Corynebacterium casei TaxID=160386 RepID=UPI003F930C54
MSSVVSFSGGVVLLRPDAARSLAKAVIQASDAMAKRGQVMNPAVINLAMEISSAAGHPEPDQPPIEHAYEYEHITSNEAAEILGCSTRYIRRLAADGRLPGERRGAAWIFDREDIEVYKSFNR